MRILVIGATGTIGSHVVEELRRHHDANGKGDLEIIEASRSSAPHSIDAGDDASVKALFESVDDVDAVVSTIGTAEWVSSGIVGEFAFPGGSSSAVVNRGLDAFVKTASPELPDLRLNTVSATVLEESAAGYASAFPGAKAISGESVGKAFVRSVFGIETGQSIRVWG